MKSKGTRPPALRGSHHQAETECKAETPICSKSISNWRCAISTKYWKSAVDDNPHFPVTEEPDVKHLWTQCLQRRLRSRMWIFLHIYWNTLNQIFNWPVFSCLCSPLWHSYSAPGEGLRKESTETKSTIYFSSSSTLPLWVHIFKNQIILLTYLLLFLMNRINVYFNEMTSKFFWYDHCLSVHFPIYCSISLNEWFVVFLLFPFPPPFIPFPKQILKNKAKTQQQTWTLHLK